MTRISCAVSLLTLSALGCPKPATHNPDTVSDAGVADAGPPDAGPPVRTVEEDHPLLGTTPPTNLLWDPLLEDTGSAFGFFAISVRVAPALGTRDRLLVPTPSGTPALAVKPSQHTAHAVAIASFPGGRGPLHAEVWVRGDTADVFVAPEEFQVQVGEAWIEKTPGGTVLDLLYVPDDDVVLGDAHWHHYVGNISTDLPLLNVLVVTCTQAGATLVMAGPVVVPEELVMHRVAAGALVPSPLPARAHPADPGFNMVRQMASTLRKQALEKLAQPR